MLALVFSDLLNLKQLKVLDLQRARPADPTDAPLWEELMTRIGLAKSNVRVISCLTKNVRC